MSIFAMIGARGLQRFPCFVLWSTDMGKYVFTLGVNVDKITDYIE